MKTAFTLIELLVVLVIITLVMGVVIPKGAKMLSGYEKSLARIQDKQTLSKAKAKAFLEAKDIDIHLGDKTYHITKKGVIFAKSHDHH